MRDYFLDIETYEWNEEKQGYSPVLNSQKFFLGAIKERKKPVEFHETRESMFYKVKELLNGMHNRIWAFHHSYDFNGYTYTHLRELLEDKDIKIIRMNPLLIINQRTNSWLQDMKGYLMGSLDMNSQMLESPKLEMPLLVQNKEEVKPYLKKDVELLEELLDFIVDTYKETGYSPKKLLTSSKSAFGRFISKINKDPISGYLFRRGKIHKYEYTIPFLIQGSKGGRSEVFKYGNRGECRYWDKNNWYLEIMRTMPFPDLLKEVHFNKDICTMISPEVILKKEGIAHAQVKIDVDLPVGLLGVRYTKKNSQKYKLIFPKKKGTIIDGFWTHAELRFAQEKGYKIIRIYESVRYSKNLYKNPLTNYINELFTHITKYKFSEKPREKFKYKIMKQLGTGLYGKFIQQQQEKVYTWIKRHQKDEFEENGFKMVGESGDYIAMKELGRYIPPYQSIIIGALISAYARIELTKILLEIDPKRLVYCDTDGIIIEKFDENGNEYILPECMKIGTELGEFKLESEGETYIHKIKTYMVGNSIHIAGVPRKLHDKKYFTERKSLTRQRAVNFSYSKQNFEEVGTFLEETVESDIGSHEEYPLYIKEFQR